MSRHVICQASELPPGARKLTRIGGTPIAVFNVDGNHYAIRDTCPHQGGSLCAGTVGGTMLPSDPHRYSYGMEGCVVRCPWHGWEFDLETGCALFDPRRRAHVYPVIIDGDEVVIEV
jgi:3-phenylpropionate/trans-cinnamate dioxygenase ferredoxin subunit